MGGCQVRKLGQDVDHEANRRFQKLESRSGLNIVLVSISFGAGSEY